MSPNLLAQISELVTIDIDCMDPEIAQRHTPSPALFFCDMTSNQAIVSGQATLSDRTALLRSAIDEVKEKQSVDSDNFAQDVLDIFVCYYIYLSAQLTLIRPSSLLNKCILISLEMYMPKHHLQQRLIRRKPFFTGGSWWKRLRQRVYQGPFTLKVLCSSLFTSVILPRSRVCIKIPTTAEGMIACAQLRTEGIQTLATCLFNVPQALAAHQAQCVYVAPYFNGSDPVIASL